MPVETTGIIRALACARIHGRTQCVRGHLRDGPSRTSPTRRNGGWMSQAGGEIWVLNNTRRHSVRILAGLGVAAIGCRTRLLYQSPPNGSSIRLEAVPNVAGS